MKKTNILTQLQRFSQYCEGYNQSKDYDVLLWNLERSKSLPPILFNEIDCNYFCSIVSDYFDSFGYKCHDYILFHRCDLERLINRLESEIHEKYES